MSLLKVFVSNVNKLSDGLGKIFSILVFPMIFILIWEVFSRYVLNRPTLWAHELSALLYAIYFLVGGSYTSRWNAHISVDILYNHFSKKTRAIIDLFTWVFFYLFVGVLLWGGIEYAWISIKRMEHSSSTWGPAIWPVKIFIPLGAFLILLQGLTKTLNDIFIVFKGHDLSCEND